MDLINHIAHFKKHNALFFLYKRLKCFQYDRLKDFVDSWYSDCDKQEALIKSMKRCFIFLGVTYEDYWKRAFESKGIREKMDFVPYSVQTSLYHQVNPLEKYGFLLENKKACYDFFKRYYKREMVSVEESEIELNVRSNEVVAFLKNNDRFVIKPINSSGGRGVELINTTDKDIGDVIDELYNKNPQGFILEEFINQSREMALFHPKSINSIRIITINYGDEIEIKWPFLRVGRGDSVVDNARAGGIIVTIDVNTGITFAAGDETRHLYKTHPDSGVSLLGYKIPHWSELCELAREMASLCPDCHIMGWDMALTDDGWIVVECNYGPNLVYQYVSGEGFAREFALVRKRLGAKKYNGYYWSWQFMPQY